MQGVVRVLCRESARRQRRISGREEMDFPATSSQSHIFGLARRQRPQNHFLSPPPHSTELISRLAGGGAPVHHVRGLSSRMPLLCHYSGGGDGGGGNNNNDDNDNKKGDEGVDDEDENDDDEEEEEGSGFEILGGFLRGWRERVAADPQFLFKVLMEELVGVSSCVAGDMASRPNFGLDELDFVFSRSFIRLTVIMVQYGSPVSRSSISLSMSLQFC